MHAVQMWSCCSLALARRDGACAPIGGSGQLQTQCCETTSRSSKARSHTVVAGISSCTVDT
ncbi:hypothetical protein HaLaN_10264 [Haematococcus lacustris]|uniref:Uncharacterized protein n=1 Tax=Haematococcus lacustris TaxID=44745 RepID=A0A699YYE0_HAELA|nr:hypothetical protein HaLaN_10264 [Haematococcus lacustris]